MSRQALYRAHATWTLNPDGTVVGTNAPYVNDDGLGSNAGGEPAGYTSYSSLSGANFFTRVTAAGGNVVSLPAGTYTIPGFGSDSQDAAHVANPSNGLVGAGSSQSIITMAAQTSSGATYSAAKNVTNPYLMGRFYGSGSGELLQDLTLQGTPQTVPNTGTGGGSDTYGGFSLKGNGWTIKRVKVKGIPGTDKAPPGETFGLNLFQVYGTVVMQDVEIDGQGIGASNFGVNGSGTAATVPTTLMKVDRLYTHDNPYSGGFALWQTKFDPTSYFNDCVFNNCRCFWNVERCSGTVTLNRPRIGVLQTKGAAVTGVYCESDNTWGATESQAFQFIVRDPRNLDGSTYSGPKISVTFGGGNDGGTNYYGRSNFKCYDASGNDISANFFSYGTGGFN